MAVITQSAAVTRANEIRDETVDYANTAVRVGGLLRDMVDSMWPLSGVAEHIADTTTNPHHVSISNIYAGTLAELNAAISDGDVLSVAAASTTYAPLTRTFTAGAGMTGGGSFAADRTFNIGEHADGSIVVNADNIQVGVISDAQHGSRGGGPLHAVATESANGFMSVAQVGQLANATSHLSLTNNPHSTSIANIAAGTLAQLNTAISDANVYSTTQVDTLIAGCVPTSRQVIAGNGCTGGGALTSNVTINVANLDSTIVVGADGIRVGTITNSQITDDTISAAKITHGSANTVLWSNGTISAWSGTPTLSGLTLSTATNTTLQVTAGTSGTSRINLGDTDDADVGAIYYNHSTNALIISAGAGSGIRFTQTDVSPYSAGYATLGASYRWGAAHFASASVTGGIDCNDSDISEVDSISAYAFVPRGGEVTLNSAGAITVTGTAHTVDTYADAASDTLDTINDPGWPVGTILALRQENNDRDVTIAEGGNINLPYGKTSQLLGHASIPVLLVKCLSGAWSLMPPAEQEHLQTMMLYSGASSRGWSPESGTVAVFESIGATTISVVSLSTESSALRFTSSMVDSSPGIISYNNANNFMSFSVAGTSELTLSSSALFPTTNSGLNSGDTNYRWGNVYQVNANLTGYAEFDDMTAPSAPSDGFRFYSVSDRAEAIFANGHVIELGEMTVVL